MDLDEETLDALGFGFNWERNVDEAFHRRKQALKQRADSRQNRYQYDPEFRRRVIETTKRYFATPKGKRALARASRRRQDRYRQDPEYRARVRDAARKYNASPKGKARRAAWRKKYRQRPDEKERRRIQARARNARLRGGPPRVPMTPEEAKKRHAAQALASKHRRKP